MFSLSNLVSFLFLYFFLQLSKSNSLFQVDVLPQNDVQSGKNPIATSLTYPIRLTDNIESNSIHFKPKQSFSSEETSLLHDEFSNPVYKIQAFKKELIVHLRPDVDFLAPSFTTAYTWKNNSLNNGFSMSPPSVSPTHCFYEGIVAGDENSDVSLSICGSLTGTIKTNNSYFYISQLNDNSDSINLNSDQLIPHSIRRRSINTEKISRKKRSSCGVNESRNTRRYKRSFSRFFQMFKDEPAKSRSKRSFESRQHYIETMIVADASMVKEHGSDLEHYILSIMMLANRAYSHPSLGSAIKLTVVKIMVLEEDDPSLHISTNAAHTLRNFCMWQKQHNQPDDTNPQHYDLAILLTRKNLCGDSCDTLGMAEVGAMCSSRHSCAIVEDDGLSASHTIAHEVGHVLNMMHDDNRVCRKNFANIPQSHIMSSTITRIDDDQPWSLCSRQAVVDFFLDGRGDCLLDKPQKPKVYPTSLPGASYDVNTQCEMTFGVGATECPYMRECSRLWCQLPSGTRANQCHTRNFPRADGSPCSPGNHCMRGKCVPKSQRVIPVDGDWGSWSQYGSCSRSCGGGVQQSSRQCNNPSPRDGGKYCIGSRLQFRSCNTDRCPNANGRNRIDFRSEQCATYNGQRFPFLGVRVASTWVPKYSDVFEKDRCKLICSSLQSGSYITLSDRVVDGTRCGPDTTDICVQGQCMPAGCDGVLGSKSKYNKCGLCNMSNKHCARVTGKYNKRLSGYNDVFTFPKGAASIKVQQKSFRNQIHDGNYLALVRTNNGQYVLNGGLTLTTIKKDIELNGTVLQYSGVQVTTEKVSSTMPLNEPITLQVLSLGLSGLKIMPPRIKYSYYIAKSQMSSKQLQTLTKRKKTKTPSRLSTTPKTEVSRWVTGRWRKCKVIGQRKCGVGWRKRKVTCKAGKRRSNSCDAHRKPYQRLPCYVSDCPTKPPKQNTVINSPGRNGDPAIVNRSKGDIPVWNAGTWGSCSSSCGFGTKWRQVICQSQSGKLLSLSLCDRRTRPSSVHGCKLRDCW